MPSRKNELVDVEARLVHQTEKAFLLDAGHTDKRAEWVAKSVVETDVDRIGDSGIFTMPRAIAEEKGFI